MNRDAVVHHPITVKQTWRPGGREDGSWGTPNVLSPVRLLDRQIMENQGIDFCPPAMICCSIRAHMIWYNKSISVVFGARPPWLPFLKF